MHAGLDSTVWPCWCDFRVQGSELRVSALRPRVRRERKFVHVVESLRMLVTTVRWSSVQAHPHPHLGQLTGKTESTKLVLSFISEAGSSGDSHT